MIELLAPGMVKELVERTVRIEIPIADQLDDRELEIIGAIVHLLESPHLWSTGAGHRPVSVPTQIEKKRIVGYLHVRYGGDNDPTRTAQP